MAETALRPMPRAPAQEGRARYLVVLGLVAAVVTAVGVLLGITYYQGQRALIQRQVQDNLVSVARLKAQEIVRWRQTALSQADYFDARKVGRVDVPPWLSGTDPAAADRVRQLLADNVKYRGFERVTIYDPVTGKSMSSDGTTGTAHEIEAAVDALHTNAAAVKEPYLSGANVALDVTTPVAYADGTRVGVVMTLDLRAFLYPFIQTWPVPSASAETLLARKEGDHVLYLNDLRFRADAALRMTYPLSEKRLLAVQALEGRVGAVSGTDYRGQRVLGAVERISGSDWVIVAKMDESEAYAPVEQAAVVATGGVSALMLILAAGLVAAWRIQISATLRDRAALAERYAFLSRNANDVVLLLDADLRILEINDRGVETYGYSREELLGMPVADLRAPATRSAVTEDYLRLRESGGSLVWETEDRRKDGTMFPVEVSGRQQAGAEGTGYVAIVRDITERRAAEEARREVEEKYRYVFDHSMVAKSITKPSGEIDVNDAFLEMTGYTREEIGEHGTWQQLTHPDDVPATDRIVAELLSGERTSARFEKRYVHKDGSIIWADLSTSLRRDEKGEPEYFMTTVIDITARRAVEEELRRTHAILQAAMDQSPAGIAVADAPDGKLRYVNDAGLLIRGGDRQAIVDGVGIDRYVASWQLLDLDGRPLDADEVPLARAILFGEVNSREFVVRRSEDDDRVVLANAAPIISDEGSVVAAIVVFTDITERKAVEEELEAYRQHLEALVQDRTEELNSTNEELVSANEELTSLNEEMTATNEELASVNEELASVNEELQVTNDELQAATMAKSEFLANMSHELRTPLNSIIGFAGVMLQGLTGDLTDEQRNQLTMIRRSGERLLALISDILDLSRIESGRAEVKPVDIRIDDLIASAIETVRPLADDHGLRLATVGPPSGSDIRTDEPKVHQVLVNLLANAVKFTDQGSVTLEVGSPSDSTVVFRVSDTGVGIAPEDLAEVFDEFVQIPREGAKPEGTGLGLAISRRLAGMLGGSLTASSVVGEGSTFTLVLPRVYRGPSETGPA